MMTALGVTREKVDEMTLEEALDLFHYWRRVPPIAETMLAWAGGDPSNPEERRTARGEARGIPSEGDIRQMADLLNRR